MGETTSNRRRFLQKAAAIGGLVAAQEVFATELSRLALQDVTASTFTQLRRQYLLASDVIYLNHASIGTTPRLVHEARRRYLDLCETNPWLYMWGGEWEEPREEVRAKAARLLSCKSSEVVFTHNTTEAFNLLAHGLPLGPGDEVLFSSLNHPGASIAWSHVAEQRGYKVQRFQFPISDVPRLSRNDVLNIYDQKISSATRVLVFPHIDNIVGLRYPVKELARLAHDRGVEFVAVDGAQAVGMIPMDLDSSGVDVYASSPHKWLQAPKGVGLLYVRETVQPAIRPMWVTWGQNRWRGTVRVFEDYGTRNVPEVLALGDAIDFNLKFNQEERQRRLHEIWGSARTRTEQSGRALWRSPADWELSSSLYAIEIRGVASEKLFDVLYRNHGLVFRAFNTQGLNTARISPNVFTREEELDRFFQAAEKS